jgi:hypothetical protein
MRKPEGCGCGSNASARLPLPVLGCELMKRSGRHGVKLTWDRLADQFTGQCPAINQVRPRIADPGGRIVLPSYCSPAARSSARCNGPSRSTISACCATSSGGAIPSDVLITPPTMIRKPRRFASSASASASVSPPALASLILIAWYFPSSRSRSARVRQDSSAQRGIGRSNRAGASSASAGSGCSISATLKSMSIGMCSPS